MLVGSNPKDLLPWHDKHPQHGRRGAVSGIFYVGPAEGYRVLAEGLSQGEVGREGGMAGVMVKLESGLPKFPANRLWPDYRNTCPLPQPPPGTI